MIKNDALSQLVFDCVPVLRPNGLLASTVDVVFTGFNHLVGYLKNEQNVMIEMTSGRCGNSL